MTVGMPALFKIADLTKSDPTGACQITEIEESIGLRSMK